MKKRSKLLTTCILVIIVARSYAICKNWNLRAYIHVLVVPVAQTCETSPCVSVVCHTQENYEPEKRPMATVAC